MPSDEGRPLAPHVQAAIARGLGVGVQPKTGEAAGGRPMAPHVYLAIARGQGVGVQPKTGEVAGGRTMAPHVQTAIALGRGGGAQPRTAAAGSSGRQLAAHVERAVALGTGRGEVVQRSSVGVGKGKSTKSSSPSSPKFEFTTLDGLKHLVKKKRLDKIRSELDKAIKHSRKIKLRAKAADVKLKALHKGTTDHVREKSSYASVRHRQILRWLATVVFAKYKGTEVQCYYDKASKTIWISSNKNSVNELIRNDLTTLTKTLKAVPTPSKGRLHAHKKKLFHRTVYPPQKAIYDAIEANRFQVPTKKIGYWTKAKYYKGYWYPRKWVDIDKHAERRIQAAVGSSFDPGYLGGVKRPCLTCAQDLDLKGSRPGPWFPGIAALWDMDRKIVKKTAIDRGMETWVTRDKYSGMLMTGHDTDSDSDVS